MDSGEICHQLGKNNEVPLLSSLFSLCYRARRTNLPQKRLPKTRPLLLRSAQKPGTHKGAHHDKTMISSPPFLSSPEPPTQKCQRVNAVRSQCSVLSFSPDHPERAIRPLPHQ